MVVKAGGVRRGYPITVNRAHSTVLFQGHLLSFRIYPNEMDDYVSTKLSSAALLG